MKLRIGALVLASVLLCGGAIATVPVPVAPGSQVGGALVSGTCPTFHWTLVEGASRVELAVFEVSRMGLERVISVTLPGSASGWTPTLDQCLHAGQRYAWSVAAGGEWSEASLFEVVASPSAAAVEEAMAVLKQFLDEERLHFDTELADATTGLAPRVESEDNAVDLAARSESTEWRLGLESTRRSTGPSQQPSDSPSLAVDEQIHLGARSDLYRDGEVFLWTNASVPVVPGSSLGLGMRALARGSGRANTAVGHAALEANGGGSNNSALGSRALHLNVTGSDNSAFGEDALYYNLIGDSNSAFGQQALLSNTTGFRNSAFGEDALRSNTTGFFNSAFGENALRQAETGRGNIAIGRRAGYNLGAVDEPTGASTYTGNVFIGNEGQVDDQNTMRLGGPFETDWGTGVLKTYVAGIHGSTVSGRAVAVDPAGQLGAATAIVLTPASVAPPCENGTVYYDSDDEDFCVCRSSNWFFLDGTATSSGECGTP